MGTGTSSDYTTPLSADHFLRRIASSTESPGAAKTIVVGLSADSVIAPPTARGFELFNPHVAVLPWDVEMRTALSSRAVRGVLQ